MLKLLLLVLVTGLTARSAAGQRGGIAGVVRDSTGRPVALAAVVVGDHDLPGVSDDSGRFALTGIPAGARTIEISRGGYRPVVFEVIVAADSTIIVAIYLRPIQTLPAVVATASPTVRRLETAGFYDRRRIGMGTFIGPERIDSLAWLHRPSDLLRDVRGITIRCGPGTCIPRPSRGGCLNLLVNGVGHRIEEFDQVISVGQIAAIEIYERASLVPAELMQRLPVKSETLSRTGGCGVIVVQTR